jgi:hypothetical protein
MILKFNFRRALYFCLTPSGPACLGCSSTSGRPQIKNWHKTKCSYNNILGGVHLIQNTPYHCPLMKPSRRFLWKDILFTIAWNWLTITHTTLLLTTTNIKLCGSGRMKVLQPTEGQDDRRSDFNDSSSRRQFSSDNRRHDGQGPMLKNFFVCNFRIFVNNQWFSLASFPGLF